MLALHVSVGTNKGAGRDFVGLLASQVLGGGRTMVRATCIMRVARCGRARYSSTHARPSFEYLRCGCRCRP
jgi:hypothetical protein